MLGTVVRDTHLVNDALGVGLSMYEVQSGDIRASVLDSNSTSGLFVQGAASSVMLSHSAVSRTSAGGVPGFGEQVFGDGADAVKEASLDVLSSLLWGNARAGAFYDHAKGPFEGNVASGNSWALVVQDSLVDWEDGKNDLTCNEHPGATSPGLTVPEIPDLTDEVP
jgi:hypothetical protein